MIQKNDDKKKCQTIFRIVLVSAMVVYLLPLCAEASITINADHGTQSLTIDPVQAHVVGDTFNISGSADTPASELLLEIRPSDYHPGNRQSEGIHDRTAAIVNLIPDSGSIKTWTFALDTTAWIPQTYVVVVTLINPNDYPSSSALFTLSEKPTPVPTLPVGNHTPSVRPSPSTMAPKSASTTAPLSYIVVIIAMFCTAVVIGVYRKE
jgi:trimeric autotransporter adhesin